MSDTRQSDGIGPERRCEVAQKTTKKTTKKKAASKPRTRSAKGPAGVAAQRKGDKGKNPLYVLVIMGLVTAIALMVNRYTFRQEPVKESPKKEVARTERPEKKAKEEARHDDDSTVPDKSEKKPKAEKKEKAEKIVKQEKTAPPQKKEGTEKPATDEVKVYFVKLNEKSEKMYLSPVTRNVPKGSLLENTMKELIKGPTSSEKKRGHLTAVPQGLKINSIRIKNRSAEIDFNGVIEQGASGSILINRIDQIVYTATQFPSVNSVVIKINGKPKQTLGTDGLSIGGPLHRR